MVTSDITWRDYGNYGAGYFQALGGPCEVLVDGSDRRLISQSIKEIFNEVRRIESKFSRFRSDSVVTKIHEQAGELIAVDEETASLLDYAAAAYALSGGLFDITSGILRRAWDFSGQQAQPNPAQIKACLPLVGWDKVYWHAQSLLLPRGMEIDLGGIGKEYAVDRCAAIARQLLNPGQGAVINFGGDLHVIAGRLVNGFEQAWCIGLADDQSRQVGVEQIWELRSGAIATSGSTRRFILHEGRRFGHILDPRTGWPVVGAPLSVSVASSSCSQAGLLSTCGMLHGSQASTFCQAQGLPYRIIHADGTVEGPL